MRFFDELRNPSLKCARLGHKEGMEYRSGYVRSQGYRAVADSVDQERPRCKRCREALGEWVTTDRDEIHSLSMPPDHMRIFEKTGEFWH